MSGYDLLLNLYLLVSLFPPPCGKSIIYNFAFFVFFYLYCFLVDCYLSPLRLSWCCGFEFCCYWFSLSSLIIMACLRNHNAVHNNAIISFYTFIVIVLRAQTSWVNNLCVHLNVILPTHNLTADSMRT